MNGNEVTRPTIDLIYLLIVFQKENLIDGGISFFLFPHPPLSLSLSHSPAAATAPHLSYVFFLSFFVINSVDIT